MVDPTSSQQENEPLKLLDLMSKTFNLAEIRELCFELDIDYEALGENLTLRNRIIALIEYARRRRRLDDLYEALQRRRPEEDWPRLSADSDWSSIEEEEPQWLDIEPSEMVKIVAGEFSMGDETGDSSTTGESSSAEIYLPQYWMGKSPVSIKEYAIFLYEIEKLPDFWPGISDKIAPPPGGWSLKRISHPSGWSDNKPPDGSSETEPVQGVTWFAAAAYCEWLSTTTGRQYTLPSEAQWEKAAKQNDGLKIQWGLVREWTRTIWGVSRSAPGEGFGYPYSKDDQTRNRLDAGHYLYRVYRGKGYTGDKEISVTIRGGFLPYHHGPEDNLLGFRAAFVR